MVARGKSVSLLGYDSFEVRLGDELRGERATLGKSLLDVQRDLRIKAAYIAAIENCDTSVFQNKGFVAGYVRSYARYLNLNAETVFERFCHEANFGGVNAGMNPKPGHAAGAKPAKSQSKHAAVNSFVHPALRGATKNTSVMAGFSASGVGSIAVLIVLICGLGYGTWSILQDIQRVRLVPVDQTPGASASVVTPDAPEIVDLAGSGALGSDSAASELLYTRIYRPQELDVPLLDHRDGPIANIDPDANGLVLNTGANEAAEISSLVAQVDAEQSQLRDPQLVENTGPPIISVFATNPAWIRVYLQDGSRVFEKILETGEAYVLPAGINAPLLRAGNSGSVFLAIGDVAYGPVGSGTAIAKDVSLVFDDVQAAYGVAEEQAEFASQALARATSSDAPPVAANATAAIFPDTAALAQPSE